MVSDLIIVIGLALGTLIFTSGLIVDLILEKKRKEKF